MRGLDVGCGANAVYSILGAAAMGWHMTGVDTDATAVAAAHDVLAAEAQLQPLVALHTAPFTCSGQSAAACSPASRGCIHADSSTAPLRILSSGAHELEPFDFCVCNPPFFEDAAHANQNPATADGGVDAELACAGGEAAFVGRMIDESVQHPHMCHWFSSMLGRKVTFKTLRKRLNGMPNVTSVRSSVLAQGRTHRWVLAWSFVVPVAFTRQALRVSKRCGGDVEDFIAESAAVERHEPLSRPAKRRAI